MGLHLINDDIFVTGAKYIAHQTNCISNSAAGLAQKVFEKYPYANTYINRVEKAVPGTIDVFGDGIFYRNIINMNAQYYPGESILDTEDTESNRKIWFHQCLLKISEIENLQSIAFPYKIGCNLAGGNWDWYQRKLEKFSEYIEKKV